MSIKTRVKHLEKRLSPARPEVFLYRVIIGECEEGETPPPVAVVLRAGGETVRLDRSEGETIEELRSRASETVAQKTGARYAVGVDESIKKT